MPLSSKDIPVLPERNWDLRSDTVTKPTADMLAAMVAAPVGDDVFGEDPTVNELEQTVAGLCGHEAALFCASATMANQLAIRTHLHNPPESVICHADSHIYKYEAGGASLHSQAQTIPIKPQGANLTVGDISRHFISDDRLGHQAPTHLITLENTLSGVLMPLQDIIEIGQYAKSQGAKVHLDGSRLWNAAAEEKRELGEYAQHSDSLSLCLSKGMGCPVGALLVGSRQFVSRARLFRKAFGGGWRQAGILAAAGLYAIQTVWPAMPATHERARRLARGLEARGFKLALPVHTNMVMLSTNTSGKSANVAESLAESLLAKGIVLASVYDGELRIVLHHQIDDECVDIILGTADSLLC
ncbi:Threonine aldolase [Coemansia sp. RSA 2322]|nr:Threonine aldolase [Coemansia sp. RSA 2322]